MRIKRGEVGILAKDVAAVCCGGTLAAGSKVLVWSVTSPNRVIIEHQAGEIFYLDGRRYAASGTSLHKVRASSLWFAPEPVLGAA